MLNPKYEFLRPYMQQLEDYFEHDGRTLHKGRNTIRLLSTQGLTLCVKRYAPPSFKRQVQQYIYKASKGKQAYVHPILLKERGFESPESIALVRYRHGLWRMTTYFVCLKSSYRFNLEKLATAPTEEQEKVLPQFARFVAHLHEDGFLHRDFSSSNILFDKVGDRYHFSLVDTNSMKCGTAVSIEQGCKNLAQLTGDDHFFACLAQCYAKERHIDPILCAKLINEARRK